MRGRAATGQREQLAQLDPRDERLGELHTAAAAARRALLRAALEPAGGNGNALRLQRGGLPGDPDRSGADVPARAGRAEVRRLQRKRVRGRTLLLIWPSATPPPPAAPGGPITMYLASLVVASSQIQIPGPIGFPDTCIGSSSIATANVCNAGTNDLHVDPITSSDPQFTVVTPSSGFPVTIKPGSCFPLRSASHRRAPGTKRRS